MMSREVDDEMSNDQFPQIDGVTLTDKLGKGSYSIVFRGFDHALSREMAVKIIAYQIASGYDRKFRQEARTLATLRHPNIVEIYRYGLTVDGRPYFCMELVKGVSLSQRLSEGKLSLIEFKAIFDGILGALEFSHSMGLIHRDIKPANIMVCQEETVVFAKLVDFGIAKSYGGDADTSACAIGTPMYMSPEHVTSSKTDERSDLYSLGCVMYESLAGQVPFAGRDVLDVMYRHCHDHRPTVQSLMSNGCPRQLADFVLKALEIDPLSRYQTASEMKTALGSIRGLERNEAHAPAALAKQPSRNHYFAKFTLITMLLLAVCGLTFSYRSSKQTLETATATQKNRIRKTLLDSLAEADACLAKGNYKQCLQILKDVERDKSASVEYLYSAYTTESKAWRLMARNTTELALKKKYCTRARQAFDRLIDHLDTNEKSLTDGALAFGPTLSEYFSVEESLSNDQGARQLFEHLAKRSGYQKGTAKRRQLVYGFAEYLRCRGHAKEYDSFYKELMELDRQWYAERGFNTLNDEQTRLQFLLSSNRNPQEQEALKRTISEILNDPATEYSGRVRTG